MSDLSSNTQADLEKAQALIQLRRYADALPLAAAAVDRDPDDVKGWLLLVRAHIGLEQGQAAVDCAHRAVSLAPDNASTHYLLSFAWDVQGSKGLATHEAREAVRLDPDDWRNWVRLADRLTKSNAHNAGINRGWEEAAHAAEQARRLGPLEPATHLAVGFLEAEAGNLKAAQQAYLKVLEIDPQNAQAHNGLARLQLPRFGRGPVDAGSLSRAASGFATAVQVDPESSIDRQNLEVVLDASIAHAAWSIWLPAYVALMAAIAGQHRPGNLPLLLIPLMLLLVPVGFVTHFVVRLKPSVRRHLPNALRSHLYRIVPAICTVGVCALVVVAAATPASGRPIPSAAAAVLAAVARVSFTQLRKLAHSR